VAKFCDALAELYGNLGKPALDMYLFSQQLERNLGDRGMGGLWWAYYATAALMRIITPNFGKLRETEARLEVRFPLSAHRPVCLCVRVCVHGLTCSCMHRVRAHVRVRTAGRVSVCALAAHHQR
jgi:hypothetical protein